MRHPARVHQLDEQRPSTRVHSVGDFPPALNMFRRVDPGGVEVALPVFRGLGAFGNDQAQGRPLRVVGRGVIAQGAIGVGPAAGHGCQGEPVRKGHAAKGEWMPEGR